MVSPYEKISLKILGSTVKCNPFEELLGITVDCDLAFNKHMTSLCSKGNQKLSALARIGKYLTIYKRKILLNSFIRTQFNYSPLIWMRHSRTSNCKINRIQERALRTVYNDYKSNFKKLIERDLMMIVGIRGQGVLISAWFCLLF